MVNRRKNNVVHPKEMKIVLVLRCLFKKNSSVPMMMAASPARKMASHEYPSCLMPTPAGSSGVLEITLKLCFFT